MIHDHPMINVPFSPIFFLFLIILLFLIKVQIIKCAYKKIGIHHYSLLLLLLSLLGSYVNIPIWSITSIRNHFLMSLPGWRYLSIPFFTTFTTDRITIAVNLGGAVIPSIISFHLMTEVLHPGKTALATLIVSFLVHFFARPVPGLGVVISPILPAASAALCSMLIDRCATPKTAYIAGSIGTLIGADLANLTKIGSLGASMVSIGGAGTFDGIFLSGIVAALMA